MKLTREEKKEVLKNSAILSTISFLFIFVVMTIVAVALNYCDHTLTINEKIKLCIIIPIFCFVITFCIISLIVYNDTKILKKIRMERDKERQRVEKYLSNKYTKVICIQYDEGQEFLENISRSYKLDYYATIQGEKVNITISIDNKAYVDFKQLPIEDFFNYYEIQE